MTLPPIVPTVTEIPAALAAMTAYDQWVLWDLVDRGDEKPAKVPCNAWRIPVNAHDPRNWMTAADALAAARKHGLGLGFVFTKEDPLFFLDIDNCATEDGAHWKPHALELLNLLPRAAAETSVSGRGLHVFGRCPPGFPEHSEWYPDGLELYTSGRFVALGFSVTRGLSRGDANEVCAEITGIAERYFPPREPIDVGMWTDEPVALSGMPAGIPDDTELVRKAKKSQSANSEWGNGASFLDLWKADADKLAAAFPPQGNGPYNASSADSALATHLAGWTGKNCEQIQRLMLHSELARGKWTGREDYLATTILKAVALIDKVYVRGRGFVPHDANTPSAPPPPPPLATTEILPVPTYPYADPETIGKLWCDYVYVISVNRVMTPAGELLDESRFKHAFGGHDYAVDNTGGKPTKNAWKAFIDSQCFKFRRANRLCFRPGDSRLTIPENGEVLANTWRDPKPRRVAGDASLFVDHIRRLLPHGHDAQHLLAYIAACVQHQGVKFTWCPVVQGVQGNGKSTIAEVLKHAIGEKYTHTLLNKSLGAKFNSWMSQTSLVIADDFHLGGSESALEMIKPLITMRQMPIERKGVDQTMEDVVANFFFATNHKDAMPLDPNERRWAVFFCAQQREADLATQGMDAGYFDRLYHWLHHEDGFAIAADFLWTYPIPAHMNPAVGCMRAPETSTRKEALRAGRTKEGQLIDEAIEDGEVGFKNGWVSSTKATGLLREHHIEATGQRLAVVLERLGYIHHPGLPGGKSPRRVQLEGKRPRLWVLADHPSLGLVGADVIERYEADQGYPREATRVARLP